MTERIIISPNQSVWKDSYASAVPIGLTLRCNGEEQTKIIDPSGNVVKAGIDAPTVAPSPVNTGTPTAKYACYAYVYVASKKYPFVENVVTGGGSLAPRSNPSPVSAPIIVADPVSTDVTCTKTTRSDIDQIWIYRTTPVSDFNTALTLGQAGLLFYSGSAPNDGFAGTVTFVDFHNTLSEQIENDNFVAPTAQFCLYFDPYFYIFGNYKLTCSISINSSGIITQTDSTTPDWFNGRNGQTVTIDGITTGGFDGFGSFYFKYLSATTAQLTSDSAGTLNATTTYIGTSVVHIQGRSTTLWRSKPRNPLSWGFTQTVGTTILPQLYTLKIGGGEGSAIAAIPDAALLKIDVVNPNASYTLNLKLAGQDSFESSLRSISNRFSVTSPATQFPALQQNGQQVLWGFDSKNFAILQSDGSAQSPASDAVFQTLRTIDTSNFGHLLAHGLYCVDRELNCIWIKTVNAKTATGCDLALVQHTPSGAWSILQENDVSASSIIQDNVENKTLVFVGTDSGILAQAFVPDTYSNFLPSEPFPVFSPVIYRVNSDQITVYASTDLSVYPVGGWILLTDADGGNEIWVRVVSYGIPFLEFPLLLQDITISEEIPDLYIFGRAYLGLIEVKLRKYYSAQAPTTNKRIEEIWVTADNADTTGLFSARFYSEYSKTNPENQLAMLQDKKQDGSASNTWLIQSGYSSDITKSFGVEFIERGLSDLKIYNLTIKETG